MRSTIIAIGAACAMTCAILTGCQSVNLERVRIVSTSDSCYVAVRVGESDVKRSLPRSICDTLPAGVSIDIDFTDTTTTRDK